MHYDFVAIPPSDVPRASNPLFQHLLDTYASDYATRNGPTLDSHDHVERQTVIRAMLMAGPDGLLH
jgi:hypothetical protein